jgi:hypothetical protein
MPQEHFGPWKIWFDPPPIPNCDWHYQHEDADAESPAWMHGSCPSRDDCLREIIEALTEHLETTTSLAAFYRKNGCFPEGDF